MLYSESIFCVLNALVPGVILGIAIPYWESDNTAEVDFLIQRDSHVIQVECKAGNHVKAKSMMVYMGKQRAGQRTLFFGGLLSPGGA